jgi:16S rRNA (cytidine1402-2'-O)-methyltransferase
MSVPNHPPLPHSTATGIDTPSAPSTGVVSPNAPDLTLLKPDLTLLTPDVSDSPTTNADSSGASSITTALARLMAKLLEPGLYLVATPIGNLADITLRALTTLSMADEIYCEDSRHSRTLLAYYNITTRLNAYHEHNAATERPRILAKLDAGRRIAIISDAGTPLISDPGFKLARAALDGGHRVISLPGPSAALAALTSSGLPSDCFLFAGFLPPRSGQRQSRLADLRAVPATLVFFEAPQRLADTLLDLLAVLGDRPAAIARELTKLHEHIRRGTLSSLVTAVQTEPPRGEFAIVVGPPLTATITDALIIERLAELTETHSLRDASRTLAESLGIPKSRVYDLGIKTKRSPNKTDASAEPRR